MGTPLQAGCDFECGQRINQYWGQGNHSLAGVGRAHEKASGQSPQKRTKTNTMIKK
ncbi:MAG: hypothetical protein R3Y65_07545 [Bacillota bacterium]